MGGSNQKITVWHYVAWIFLAIILYLIFITKDTKIDSKINTPTINISTINTKEDDIFNKEIPIKRDALAKETVENIYKFKTREIIETNSTSFDVITSLEDVLPTDITVNFYGKMAEVLTPAHYTDKYYDVCSAVFMSLTGSNKDYAEKVVLNILQEIKNTNNMKYQIGEIEAHFKNDSKGMLGCSFFKP